MLPAFTGNAFLAPMAGVSDPAMRLQCRRKGAGLVVTEFTSIHSIIAKENQLKQDNKTIREFLEYSEEEKPLSVQLFGSNIAALAKAAKIVEPFFDVIDYNMGCPAPHITKQMAGGALLQEVDLTEQILDTLVQAVKKPVTLKIRLGVTDASRYLFKDIAEIAEDCGVQMITLHARTVSQGYSGKADWDMIRELKEVAGVPIVGNGDIVTPEDAKAMLEYTNCDYVMIGRGATGNPFLFEQINDYLRTGTYEEHTPADRLDAFFEYLDLASSFNIKFANIKSQAIRFTRGVPGGVRLRIKITMAKTVEELTTAMGSVS